MITLPKTVPVHPSSGFALATGIADIINAKRSDDSFVSLRAVMRWYDTHYSKLGEEKIRDAEDTNEDIPQDLLRVMECQTIDYYEGCGDGRCNTYRLSLPNLFLWQKQKAVITVGNENLTHLFTRATADTATITVNGVGRYAKMNPQPQWYVQGNFLYVVMPYGTKLSKVSYIAALSSPLAERQKTVEFEGRTYRNCDIMSKPLDIPDAMHAVIRQRILSIEANALVNGLQRMDMDNNANPA